MPVTKERSAPCKGALMTKLALMLIQNKEHLTMEGISKIVAIKASARARSCLATRFNE
jgi:hypothetical protein